MENTVTETGANVISASDFTPIVDSLKSVFSPSNILTVIGVGIGAVGGVVLTIWGVRKITSMITNAFKRGTIRA